MKPDGNPAMGNSDCSMIVSATPGSSRIATRSQLPAAKKELALQVPVAAPPDLSRAPRNGGLEGITLLSDGRLLALTESFFDDAGNYRGWLIAPGDENHSEALALKPRMPFQLTDVRQLANGDLLTLERRYNPIGGVGFQMRRVAGASVGAGAVLDGDMFDRKQMDQFRDHVLLAIMPVFFLSTGLRTDWQVGSLAVFAAAALMTGPLVLDAQGNSAAVFMFQIGSALTVAGSSSVALINGAQASHVWWQVGSSATLGINSAMVGNVLALASITLTTNATLTGRALAQVGAVTLDTNSIVTAAGQATPTSKTSWGMIKSQYR